MGSALRRFMKPMRITSWMLMFPLGGGLVCGQLVPGVDPALPAGGAVESLGSPERTASGDPGERLGEEVGRVVLERPGVAGVVADWGGLAAGPGVEIPSPVTLASKIRPFFEGGLGVGELEMILDEILIHYDAEGYPVMLLEVPEQDFADDSVHIVVMEGRYGRVGVLPPGFGRRDVLAAGMRLVSGEVIRRGRLDRQLAWLGRTPFRRPGLLVSGGAEPATADVLIALEETRPWRLMLGYDNGGTRLLGEDRLIAGVSGMTPGEHVLAWQGVVGTPARTLEAHSVAWEIPWHRALQSTELTAALAEVEVLGLTGGLATRNEGFSWALGARQRFWLSSWGRWQQRLSAGVEVKSTDQFVLFGSTAVAPGAVKLLHATLGYGLQRSWEGGAASVDLGLLVSPGGVFSGNDDADFRAYDPLAESGYRILRVDAGAWWSIPGDFRIQVRGSGQWSDTRLLPAEQFAVGGARSVRGADERGIFGDYGWSGSLELHSPLIRPWDDAALRLLGFMDHGWVGLHRTAGAGASSASSMGLGIRFGIGESLDLRLDHGWRLDEGGGQTHFAVRLIY